MPIFAQELTIAPIPPRGMAYVKVLKISNSSYLRFQIGGRLILPFMPTYI